MTSPKTSLKEERTKSKEYCESSHDATGLCFMSYRSFVAGSTSNAIFVGGPYFAEMDFIMSFAVSPSVEARRKLRKSCRARRCKRKRESVRRYQTGRKPRERSAATKSVPESALAGHESPLRLLTSGPYALAR